MCDWENTGGVEKALLLSSENRGLQGKLLGLMGVVGTLPQGS